MLKHLNFSNVIAGTMRLGTWGANYNEQQYQSFIENCLAIEVNTFDHADIYGDYTTEAEFGKVLENNSSLRDKIQIITKCGINRVCENRPTYKIKSYDSSKEHIKASVEQSLKNFNTYYIDCLLLHRPDILMRPIEVSEAIQELKQAGKLKHFGVSNFSLSQLQLLHQTIPIEVHQIECSILQLDPFNNGVLDFCYQNNIQVQAWSPLGGGSLFSGESQQAQRIQEAAKPLLEKYNVSLDQLAFAWLTKHPAQIIPVTGTTNIDRIKSAKQAAEIKISNEDWYILYQASTGEIIP